MKVHAQNAFKIIILEMEAVILAMIWIVSIAIMAMKDHANNAKVSIV